MARIDYDFVPGTKYMRLPKLWEKYGLSIAVQTRMYWWYVAIRNHWLVCRYLEEHKKAALNYSARKEGWWYYDILWLAEEKYLDLPPYKEREIDYPDLEHLNISKECDIWPN